MTDKPKTCLTDGSPVTADHSELKDNGQQKGYVVLCPEERDKGFIRPLRHSYIHIGRKVCGHLCGDSDRLGGFQTICAMEPGHTDEHGTVTMRVSQPDAAKARTTNRLGGCGGETTMSQEIAETYARDPHFYSGTFCVHCRKHFPLEEFIWCGTGEQVGS